ncbi:MAG: stage II sporulation protein E, partial [Phycisphaerae bacterium]
MSALSPLSGVGGAGWQERLTAIVETMREMSRQTDPQEMVNAYAARMRALLPTDGLLALSRRNLPPPQYRITRSHRFAERINPWRQPERLPLLEGGLLGELLYGDRPRIINDLRVAPDDPAADHLAGQRSLLAIPNFDQGVSLNMVVLLRRVPDGFDPQYLPEWVWMSNLFGRATLNLVLSDELKRAYAIVEREMRVVADIQRSLLPAELPVVPGLSLAAHYE